MGNTKDETQEEKLFEIEPVHGRILPTRMGAMLRIYGQTKGKKCGTCVHFYKAWRYKGPVFMKCDLNRETAGPGTDWRKTWPACGKWEEKVVEVKEEDDGTPDDRTPFDFAALVRK